MSVFTLNSTQANFPLVASQNIGIDHRWALSVYEFDTDGGYELHVAFVGQAQGIESGYWCNLTPDQCERIIGLVKGFKSDDLTCADCASEIVEVLKEEPDIDLFESLMDTQTGPIERAEIVLPGSAPATLVLPQRYDTTRPGEPIE